MRGPSPAHRLRRRQVVAAATLPLALGGARAAAPARPDRPRYPAVLPGAALQFPRDHGAHPDYRIEWWYVTGMLDAERSGASSGRYGFQITFFRSRLAIDPRNPSRFAAHQLMFAHAAVSDRAARQLVHDQRAARAVFDRAGATVGDTGVWLADWRFAREGDPRASVYRARLPAQSFGLDLELRQTQPTLLQGDGGYSRKGPDPAQASWYYTQPQLDCAGTLRLRTPAGRTPLEARVRGRAWLDHEWSSEILAEGAVGWQWIGINLADGGALMAFRIRDANDRTVWGAATLRDASGRTRHVGPQAVHFEALRRWRSPRTRADYPVEARVRAGDLAVRIVPWFDDQELDSSSSTGVVYWEGATDALDAEGRTVGTGYLELTGYHRPLRL